MSQFTACLTLPGSANATAQHEAKDGTYTINGEANYLAPVEIPLRRSKQVKESLKFTGEIFERTIETFYWVDLGIVVNKGDRIDGCTVVQDFTNNKFRVS